MSVQQFPGRVQVCPTSATAFVGRTAAGPTEAPYLCESLDDFEQTFGGLTADSDLPQSVQLFFLNGGNRAVISRVADGDAHAAIDRLSMADDVNLVCISPARPGTEVSLATWLHAKAWCEDNQAMLFVDPPAQWTDAADAAALTGGYDQLRSPNVMFYFPRIEASDPADGGRRRIFAPSAAVAGLFSRTDESRGIWKAPAGIEAGLRGVTGLEYSVGSAQASRLSMHAVNCLRSIPSSGTIVWGARTSVGGLGDSSEWKYVPVRRLALHLERTIERSLDWVDREENDPALWGKITESVDAFMRDLFRSGAFAGADADQAWFVRCDPSIMTYPDIASGLLRVEVGFAPLEPGDFITIHAQRWLRRDVLA